MIKQFLYKFANNYQKTVNMEQQNSSGNINAQVNIWIDLA